MKVVGLTGGIGSGKTTIANIFKDLGVPIYIADERAKYILGNDIEVINEVKQLLGIESYRYSEGVELPNRDYIAQIVFKDKQLLNGLNKIIHPRVRLDFEEFIEKQNYSYVIYEAAILLESNGAAICDHIILVTAPLGVRVNRVMNRDQVLEKQVIERVNNQWSQRRKLDHVDLVLENIEKKNTLVFVNNIHRFLLNK